MSNITREGVEPYSTIFERLDAIEASLSQTNTTVTTLKSDVTKLKNNVTSSTEMIEELDGTEWFPIDVMFLIN